MPTTLDWVEIARRLAFTVIAGAVIGINRGERGRPAGLRTTLLVSVAACVAMIEANLLLAARIKTGEALAQFDVMRLPLGVLSGIGFIGAGAILRRSHLVIGVTTAATLWFVTIMGLCFGAGQTGLGLSAFAIATIVLWCLPWFERRMRHERVGTLTLTLKEELSIEEELRSKLYRFNPRIVCWSATPGEPKYRELTCQIRWKTRADDTAPPAFLRQLASRPDILKIEWTEAFDAE